MKLFTVSLFAIGLLASARVQAEPLTFDFADAKGVNNVVFLLDAPLEAINGTASGVSGTVTLDLENPGQASGSIIVATNSLTVPNPVMQEHMLGADWLNAEEFPEITFALKSVDSIEREGEKGTAEITGDFTLKGVTKEITIPVSATYLEGRLKDRGGDVDGDILVLRSTFTIKRSDFGIKPGEHADKVAEEIQLTLSIAGAAPKTE
ncbi:MAG: YceI family protein [Verrucomicrobiales bacterium]